MNRRNEVASPGGGPKEESQEDGELSRDTGAARSALVPADPQENVRARSAWLRGTESIVVEDQTAAVREERRAVEERAPAEEQERALVAYAGGDQAVIPSTESRLGGAPAIEAPDDGSALVPTEQPRAGKDNLRLELPPEVQSDAARVAWEIKEL